MSTVSTALIAVSRKLYKLHCGPEKHNFHTFLLLILGCLPYRRFSYASTCVELRCEMREIFHVEPSLTAGPASSRIANMVFIYPIVYQ